MNKFLRRHLDKRLEKVAIETGIKLETLKAEVKAGKAINDISATAYEIKKVADENNMDPNTLYAQKIVQDHVVKLAENVGIIHRRLQALHTVTPSRHFQYALQDTVAIVEHLGGFLKEGPVEPDSEVPLSASMTEEAEEGEVIPEVQTELPIIE